MVNPPPAALGDIGPPRRVLLIAGHDDAVDMDIVTREDFSLDFAYASFKVRQRREAVFPIVHIRRAPVRKVAMPRVDSNELQT